MALPKARIFPFAPRAFYPGIDLKGTHGSRGKGGGGERNVFVLNLQTSNIKCLVGKTGFFFS